MSFYLLKTGVDVSPGRWEVRDRGQTLYMSYSVQQKQADLWHVVACVHGGYLLFLICRINIRESFAYENKDETITEEVGTGGKVGQKDIVEKVLEAYNDVFADIVNVLVFKGERRIHEEDLEDLSPRSAYKADGKYHQLERDVGKRWKNGWFRLASVGLENQTEADADMPIRIMGYDSAEYSLQVKHDREEKGRTKKNIGEVHNKRRYPVVSLVLYFGYEHPWNKSSHLIDLLEIPEGLERWVNDYPIHVTEIAWLDREVIDLFESDFGIVADYFWQKRVKKNYIPTNTVIRHVQETLTMLSVMSGDKRFAEVWNEADGERKGPERMDEVLDRIENRGIEKGIQRGRLEDIRNMVSGLKITVDQAMDVLRVPEADREMMKSML